MVLSTPTMAPHNQRASWQKRSATPRSMRLRGGPMGGPQPLAVNAVTGRAASGPWSGSFEPAAPSSPTHGGSPFEGVCHLPGTVYMDDRGGAHWGLKPSEHLRISRSLSKAQEEAGLLADVDDSLAAAALKRELRAIQARQHDSALFAHSSRQRAAPVKVQAQLRRCRVIAQPRRVNF